MAIARGAGTEIIRTICLEDVEATSKPIIYGVQHHIYTVLSVVVYADALGTAGNWIRMFLTGYDSNTGTTARPIYIFKSDMQVDKTFVWNDKFSFNGYEPIDFAAGGAASATVQDAIADQGSGVAQILKVNAENSSDRFDITCTYIDQNNA